MTKTVDSFYPGKKTFDAFIENLPNNERGLSSHDVLSMSQEASEILREGIPYRDRSLCIYYFYHFLGMALKDSKGNNLDNQYEELAKYAISSLYNQDVPEYLKLLSAEKLYEVCQIRGEIKAYNIELIQFISGKSKRLLADIVNEAEDFLTTEPCLPKTFLEWYHKALLFHGADKAREYELAKLVWDTSTDFDSLNFAWDSLNDAENIRAYKKKTLPPEEVEKVLLLEQIEEEVMSEFNTDWHSRNMIGKALQFLSKSGREEKKALDELQLEWVKIIKKPLSFSGNDPYVNGYAAYLKAFVKGGTEDFKGAVKELKKALDQEFDPFEVLIVLVPLLVSLKKDNEALNYAQMLLDIMGLQENEEKDKGYQNIIDIFEKYGQDPIWADRLWKDKVEENKNKHDSIIKDIELKIESSKATIIEKRVERSIKLLDNFFPVTKADDALNNNISFSSVKIPNTIIDEIFELSIEELEVFNKQGVEKLSFLFESEVYLIDLHNYNEMIMKNYFDNIFDKIEDAIKVFPNTLSSIKIAEIYIAELVNSEKIEPAKILASHICKMRNESVEGIYHAIEPIQKAYNKSNQFRAEIDTIKEVRKLLSQNELVQANKDLIEAFIQLIESEKSLSSKNRFLKEAETDGLTDNRLKKIRSDVDAQINKRKKMLIKAGVIIGAAIGLFIIVYFILL
jgi:hypothetical protein